MEENVARTWQLQPPGQKCVPFWWCQCFEEWGTGQCKRHGHQRPLALWRDVSPASAIAVWWGLDRRAGGPNVTRQAETGMIQPCSEDGGRRAETERRGGGGGRIQRAHGTREERLKGRGIGGEMIMIGTTNGEFIYTVLRNSPGRWKEECTNREQHWVNEAR